MPAVGKGFAEPGVLRFPLRPRRGPSVPSLPAPATIAGQTEGYPDFGLHAASPGSHSDCLRQFTRRIMSYFSETFGAFESQPATDIAQMPDGIALRLFRARAAADQRAPMDSEGERPAALAARRGQWWGDQRAARHARPTRGLRMGSRATLRLVRGAIRRRRRPAQGSRGFRGRRVDV